MAKSRHKKFILILFLIEFFFAIFPFFIVSLVCIYFYFGYNLPSVNDIINENVEQKINVYYSNGVDKIKSYNVNSLYALNYEDIPEHFINVLLATEDKNFFKHNGFNLFSIIRAFIVNFKNKTVKQGGSTITQQLSKMILNDNSNSYKRKIRELIFAFKLEKNLSKQDILLLYLNTSYFGAGQYGIIEASNFYFNKDVKDIDIYESALLVSLLKAPSKYNPLKNFDLSMKRTKIVLDNMKHNKIIDESKFKTIEQLKRYFFYIKNIRSRKEDYFFSDYVVDKYNSILNIDNNYNEVSLISTLNKNIQTKTLLLIKQFIKEHKYQLEKTDIAVVVMDKIGQIVAMYAGNDYIKNPFNFVVNGNRQIGSLFKIFIYLSAFEGGLKVNDIYIDSPIQIGNWSPNNNDSKYNGRMSVVDAFAQSSNSVAIQIAEEYGIDKVIATAKKMGFSVNSREHLSFLLGTDSASLLNMTNIYTMIFANGKNISASAIKTIIADNGKVIFQKNNDAVDTIFSRETIKKIQYLLYAVVNNGTGKKAKIDYLIDKSVKNVVDQEYFIGGKTGTTQDSRDAWFIGLANKYIIGIWMGNNGKNKQKIMGGTLPAMLWKEIGQGIQ